MRENRLNTVTEDVDRDEYHSSEVLAVIEPQTVEVRLPDDSVSTHCPFIVSAGITVSQDGEDASVCVVTQDGTVYVLNVSPNAQPVLQQQEADIEVYGNGNRWIKER